MSDLNLKTMLARFRGWLRRSECPHNPSGRSDFVWSSGEYWTKCFCKKCQKIVEYWIRDQEDGPEWGMGTDNPFYPDPTWRKVTKLEFEQETDR